MTMGTVGTPAPIAPAAIEVLSPWREGWRVFRSNKAAMVGLVLLCVLVLTMLFAPSLYAVDAMDIVAAPFTPPFVNPEVWLGTDYLGRDVLAGILAGFMAQGVDSLLAAAMAAWIHGEAGRRIGAGLIAEDLEAQLPDILSALHGELAQG